ncbi:TPA: phage tail protein [Morganella morganii subsp. morganii]|nr:phage tail protein [Morganella morganii subsp. morganii]
MSSVITTDFERWKAQEAALGKPVALNEFVFANVPGLDPSKDISRDEKLPPAGQIVHRQAVNKAGLASENAVAYSLTLGTDVGDFVFNWIGLINKESGTLAMITHAPEQRKIKTVDGIQGNVLTRSFLLEFNGAAKETQITASAKTWQIDFTARLAGMDEMQRLANRDIYGVAAFFGDGFLVTKAAEQYRVTPGTAYIEGLRGTLEEITTFNNLRDTKIYADFTFQGNLVSKWQTFVKVTTAKTLAHYQDAAGFQHYVAVIAEIDQNGNITDKRVKGSKYDREIEEVRKDLESGDFASKTDLRTGLEKKLDKSRIVQQLSDSSTDVPSAGAVNDALKQKQPAGNYALKSDLNNYQPAGNYFNFRAITEMPGMGFSGAFTGDINVKYIKGISVSSGAGNSDTGQIYVDHKAVLTARYLNNNGDIYENRIMGVPIGATIEWQSTASIPENFLANDGRSFSASVHPELAKVFPGLKLPDDRGLFKRALDSGKGYDSGRTLGSVQGDAMRNLTGRFGNPTIEGGDFSEGVFRHSVTQGGRAAGANGNSIAYSFDASRQVSTANEFRPVNKAVIYITRVI